MNLQYHIREGDVKCPYCNKVCDNDGINALDLDRKTELECDHCEKRFYATAEVVYSTYSDCKLNGEEHELEVAANHPTVFNCKNCSHYEVKKSET